MSEKISINIEVPGIHAAHNFLVPDDMNVSKMTSLIVRILSEEYPGAENHANDCHLLLHGKSGKALDQSGSLRQLGIVNGERMILM